MGNCRFSCARKIFWFVDLRRNLSFHPSCRFRLCIF
jgi:hypothetical protein